MSETTARNSGVRPMPSGSLTDRTNCFTSVSTFSPESEALDRFLKPKSNPEGHLQSLGGYGQGGGVPVQGHASVRDLRVIGAGEIEPFCERPSRPQATCRRVFTPPLVERDV